MSAPATVVIAPVRRLFAGIPAFARNACVPALITVAVTVPTTVRPSSSVLSLAIGLGLTLFLGSFAGLLLLLLGLVALCLFLCRFSLLLISKSRLAELGIVLWRLDYGRARNLTLAWLAEYRAVGSTVRVFDIRTANGVGSATFIFALK